MPHPTSVDRWFSKHIARSLTILAMMATGSAACAAPIVVGQAAPLTGLKASDGRGYSAGLQLYFNHVNKAGGVNGNTFVLARKDDSGRADETLAVTRQLLAEPQRPLLLAGFMGAPNLAKLQQSGILEKEKIALVGYRGSNFQPESPLLFNVRAPQRDEIGKIAEHLATVGITRLGLLHEDGPDAAALVANAQEAIKKGGGELIAKGAYPADTAKVSNAAVALLAANPQAIIMLASGAAASAFVEHYRLEGGTARLFASSDVDVEQMTKRLAEQHMQGISIAQVTPNPYRASTRLSKEFRDLYNKEADPEVPVSYAMMEGYITAKVIVEAARRAGARPTRESLTAALESIDNLDLGGYVVGYQSGRRSGSRFVELSIISAAGRIRQ